MEVNPGVWPSVRQRTDKVARSGKNAGMNHDRIAGKWKQFSGALRERWGELTGNRLRVIAGRHDQRAGKAQELYGSKKAEAQRELKEFLRRNRQWDVSVR